MSNTLCTSIKFQKLCTVFESIFKSKGPEKYEHLQKFTRECRDLARRLKSQDPNVDTSLYPVFRLILPELERERGPYGLQEKNLSTLYMKTFNFNRFSDSGKKLIGHKPVASDNEDLADRIVALTGLRLREDGILTIHNINKFLDDVAGCEESHKTSKVELFNRLPNLFTRIELKWITRILLKKLRLGVKRNKIFEVIHPRAEDLFNVCSDLKRVCNEYSDYSTLTADKRIEIQVFSYIKPMLLEKLEVKDYNKLFTEGERYYVEPKFDGERSQLHMKDGKFKYFTRQGYDITNKPSYGEYSHSGGFLTANIAPLLDKNCKSIILDGEMMGWHKTRNTFGTKGQNFDVKNLTEKSYHQPCFVAFDILLYNDKVLINKPYSERLKYLNTAFKEKEGIMHLSKVTKVSSAHEILKLFNKSLDEKEEGIVIKKCDVTYKINTRNNIGCYKSKAEYTKALVTDLDLLILGGYYGSGRYTGKISSYLVGVANSSTNKNNEPTEFLALSGVSSGLSYDELDQIQQKLRPHWKDVRPHSITAPKSGAPNVWVAPKNSVVLQLNASELQSAPALPLGWTLRFPRVTAVRFDKPWFDVCTKEDFMKLVTGAGSIQKLTKRKATAEDIIKAEYDSDEKPKKVRKIPAGPTVQSSYILDKNLEVPRLSRLFQNTEICVINGDDELGKEDLQIILLQHMAKVTQNPSKNTFCVIVGNPETQKAQNVIVSENYDVVKPSWLKRATQPENLGKIQEFYPWELLARSHKTNRKLENLYDEFYDNYETSVTEEELRKLLEKAGKKMDRSEEITVTEMKKLDKALFGGVSTHSLFRDTTGFFLDEHDVEVFPFRYMAGMVSESFAETVDYVFASDDVSEKDLQQFKEKYANIKVVNSKWISECFHKKDLLPIEPFVL